MKIELLTVLLALAVGALMPVQTSLNAQMGKVAGQLEAALINFLVGAAVLGVMVLVAGRGDLRQAAGVPYYVWLAGAMGATVVFFALRVLPLIGAAGTMTALLAGQLIMAAFIDQFGWLGVEQQALDWPRLVGLALVVAGTLMVGR